MAKRNKHTSTPRPAAAVTAPTQAAPIVINPPAKRPSLLAVSLILFVLWFVFLLVAALTKQS